MQVLMNFELSLIFVSLQNLLPPYIWNFKTKSKFFAFPKGKGQFSQNIASKILNFMIFIKLELYFSAVVCSGLAFFS